MSQKAYAQGSTFPPTTPGLMRIYSMRFCPYAERTRLVLNHKNIPHEIVNINLKSKPDWFLAINPLGQTVPVLQLDDKIVPESTATCDWLDDVYPENRLQPADPYRRALDRVLFEYIGKLSASYRGTLMGTDPSDIQTNIEATKKHLQFYEDTLKARGDGPFFGGSKPSIFDFMFLPTFERLPIIATVKENPAARIEYSEIPALASWAKAMEELPGVQKGGFDVDKHTTFFRGYLKGAPEYDLFLDE